MRKFRASILLFFSIAAQGQTDTALLAPAQHTMPAVIITAYEQHRLLIDVPAAVNTVRKQELDRYGNSAVLPAVNNMPGVKMEERSLGSFRLGIRGSAFNAPFGVRNVKVYYNGIPFTDPGGTTFFNQLGYYNFQSLEVVKGPGSSLYGAGTGGVVLINSLSDTWQPGATVHYTGGSYGYSNVATELNLDNTGTRHVLRYQHIAGNGYRQHAAMQNDVVTYDMQLIRDGKNELQAHALAGFLNYETPGALTRAEYERNPRMARPATNGIPGSAENMAGIRQDMALAGLSYKHHFNDSWELRSTLYSIYVQLTNPAIRNYTYSTLPHYGGRSVLSWRKEIRASYIQWLAGAELQSGNSSETTYQNNKGTPGTITEQRNIRNINASGFTQFTLSHKKWLLQGGLSLNHVKTNIEETYSSYMQVNRSYNIIAPRLAVLHKLNFSNSLYASVSRGYTPPNSNELAPTGSYINTGLQPVYGWNYETGLRGYLLNSKLRYDICGFYFTLGNTIVQRRDSAGGDYYINAGNTRQVGLEILLNYKILENKGIIRQFIVETAYTASHYRYGSFVRLTNDYSGNSLPGIPANTIATSVDVYTTMNAYVNLNLYYNDIIPLDDANSYYANSYTLVNVRLGYRYAATRWGADIFAGCNNVLSETYSLGNDINAAGNRFYNVAPGVNYFAGVSLSYKK